MELTDALEKVEIRDDNGELVGNALVLFSRLLKFYNDNGRNDRPDPALEALLQHF